jgi:hypothetical protein
MNWKEKAFENTKRMALEAEAAELKECTFRPQVRHYVSPFGALYRTDVWSIVGSTIRSNRINDDGTAMSIIKRSITYST